MSGFLSPFVAYASRPPRTHGANDRQGSPDRSKPADSAPQLQRNGSSGFASDSDNESSSRRKSADEDELEGQSEDALNQFPALNSNQRAGSAKPPPQATPSIVPPLGSSTAPTRHRKKVPLEPGHSSVDWAKLKTSGTDLRGVDKIQRYTPSEIAVHNKRNDIWMAIGGKVYNVTHYMKYHPGGQTQLMRGAGKDATELFFKVHSWVNYEHILGDKCLVGYLVPESAKQKDATPSSASSSPATGAQKSTPAVTTQPESASASSSSTTVAQKSTPAATPQSASAATSPATPAKDHVFAVPEVPKRFEKKEDSPDKRDVLESQLLTETVPSTAATSTTSLAP
ncbi:hypothetical protein HDU96_007480 [Phlyctochytrium bullatum]|nr:hypothetical protein HDU96_007480 [Phlyctochytrium bullatum]